MKMVGTSVLDEKVLVLNRLYTAIRVVSAKRAFVLLWPEWRRLNPPLLVSGEQLPLFADGTPT